LRVNKARKITGESTYETAAQQQKDRLTDNFSLGAKPPKTGGTEINQYGYQIEK